MNPREFMIAGLREFAEFLENNPDVPLPHVNPTFDVFVVTKAELVAAAKIVGGKLRKHDYGALMSLRREFGPINYDLNISRSEVCEPVVTGKRVIPAVVARPEREEDVIEWKCKPLLPEPEPAEVEA